MPRKPYLNGDSPHDTNEMVTLSTARLLDELRRLEAADSLSTLRSHIAELDAQRLAAYPALRPDHTNEATTSLHTHYFASELDQIARSRTLERARYYIGRLIKGLGAPKTSAINDININRWKEYDHILTDSLWDIERRDSSGVHTADYWGNFVPQIPHQMMLRYTRQGEWVLDTFAGLGTTLIEGQRLGRHTLGVELQPAIVDQARQRIHAEPNEHQVTCEVVTGDSTTCDYAALLRRYGRQSVQLVMMHPPYFDIIKFSDDSRDLSNAPDIDTFLAQMGQAVERVAPVLDRGRYLVLVIGDKYADGEWIPLGFRTMQEVLSRGFLLKSIVVKNFEETTGKRRQQQLWRYRALRDGFYIFKHEYIFLFQKQ